MSFTDANTLINAFMARAAVDKASTGEASASMKHQFTQMMSLAMEEIQKAQQHNTSLPREDFLAGYNALLAGIDTTNNPKLAKAIADYRNARTKEERDALKPILANALEQSALAAERAVFSMLEDQQTDYETKANTVEPRKCSRFMECNCDNSERPFNQLLHYLTDNAIEYALDDAEQNPQMANQDTVKQLSDRKRIDFLKDYMEKERINIADIIAKFIEEGCRGFAWQFLQDLPAFREEITKHYKCRFPECDVAECMVCVCYLQNQGWIGSIQHPNLIPLEHYLGIMKKLITDAADTQDTTNLTVVYTHFSKMPNFAHYHKIFKDSVSKTNIIKNKLIKKWLKKH